MLIDIFTIRLLGVKEKNVDVWTWEKKMYLAYDFSVTTEIADKNSS
jgi:hypothetical protein